VAAVDYTAPGWAAEVRALTGGRGVDVVVDHVGQDAFAGILEALATKGRVVFCGASSGAAATVDLIDMFARQLMLIGSSDGTRRELWEVFRLLAEGRIDPPAIDTILPLEGAAQAQDRLAGRRHFG